MPHGLFVWAVFEPLGASWGVPWDSRQVRQALLLDVTAWKVDFSSFFYVFEPPSSSCPVGHKIEETPELLGILGPRGWFLGDFCLQVCRFFGCDDCKWEV